MSTVVLQVGQCGNQLGHEFWKQICQDKNSVDSCVHVCAHRDGKLRSIHIDSEPKVVQGILKDFNETSLVREDNVILGKRGRGSNWALGYHGHTAEMGDNILDRTLESLRKEIERCDSFSGTIILHSMGGGTGSGLGSHLCQVIREEYPSNYLMSCVIAPHRSGESPLQHYNSLLCLSSLQQYADAVILFHNDEVLDRLSTHSTYGTVSKDNQLILRQKSDAISFSDMNKHLASCLTGVFLPVDTLKPKSGVSIGVEPWEMLRSVCPMPAVKFLHLHHLSRSKISWENLANNMLQSLHKHDAAGARFSSLANLCVVRGDKTGSFPLSMSQVESKIKQSYNCVQWNPFPVDFWMSRRNIISPKDTSSITVAANYSNVIDHSEHILSRARDMYEANAYLHWYWKHGCEKADFEEAFDTLLRVNTDYKEHIS